MRTCLLTILLCISLAAPAAATPITPYGGRTGRGVLAPISIVSVGFDGWVVPTGYLAIGLSDSWDIIAGGGPYLAPPAEGGFQGGFAELLVRNLFIEDPDIGLALHLGWDSEKDMMLGGEFHMSASSPRFALVVNAGATMYPSGRGVASSYLHAIIAPELLLGPIAIFVEIRPAVYMPGYGMPPTPEFTLTPGVGTWFGPDGALAVSLGVALPLAPPETAPAIMFGIGGGIPTVKP